MIKRGKSVGAIVAEEREEKCSGITNPLKRKKKPLVVVAVKPKK